MKIPHLISKNNVCNNSDKKCYHLSSYNNIDIYNNKKHSTNEKSINIKKYKNSCLNKGGKLERCCSKKVNTSVSEFLKKKNIYGITEYNKEGELEKIKLCKYNNTKKCKGYKLLTPYEICKIPDEYINLDNIEVSKFTKDCFSVKCNPQEDNLDINGKINNNYNFELDTKIHLSLKDNNLKNIKILANKNKDLLDRVLTHNGEGNTIYHEALKMNASKILVYLFKMMKRTNINNLNIDGNSILHLALEKNNPLIISYCFRFGANINLRNNDEETPIYNAIRSGRYDNVLKCINKNANIYVKNKNQETPFIIACMNNKRDVSIVRLLVNNGANVDDLTKDKEEIIKYLLNKEKLEIRDEEIRTYIQNIKIKRLKLDKNKKLTVEETKKLKDILYVRSDKDQYKNYEDFNLEIEFTEDLKYPNDLHYEKDLKENYIKPYTSGKNLFSHEPYYEKYKNIQKDRFNKLKQTLKLAEWDNKNDLKKKEKIIDDIMKGKLTFDTYKYDVLNQNGLKEEQLHMLSDVEENDIFNEKAPEISENVIIPVYFSRIHLMK